MTSVSAPLEDAVLVQRSLAGDRHAFSSIVSRYQSLVCALAYSATGSRTRSEDLAQETFVTAWSHLAQLNDPVRLRAWLCGIARNVIQGDVRRLGRQPVQSAVSLDDAAAVPAVEPSPSAQAVSNEEMAILWREVSQLAETYREPLILYYREHKSIERVATALDLTPDAAMQRLSRGRRLLQERMLAFVETTLERTNPGTGFTLAVEAALPVLASTGPAIAATTAPGGALKGGVAGFLLSWAAPLVGLFAAIGVSWADIAHAPTQRERRSTARWILALWLATAGFVVTMPIVMSHAQAAGLTQRSDWVATAPRVIVWFGYVMIAVTLIVFMIRSRAALRREIAAGQASPANPAPAPSATYRVATLFGFLIALFWLPLFLAWQSSDRAVAALIAGALVVLGAAPFWLRRHAAVAADDSRAGNWYVALCGLLFLGLLNWRLDVWLAPFYGVDLAAMERLLPPKVLYGLSALLVTWTALLIFVTRTEEKPSPERTK